MPIGESLLPNRCRFDVTIVASWFYSLVYTDIASAVTSSVITFHPGLIAAYDGTIRHALAAYSWLLNQKIGPYINYNAEINKNVVVETKHQRFSLFMVMLS